MASITATSAGTSALVVQGLDQNTATGVKLLKNIDQADKNLVATLLPTPGPTGQLDIKA